MSVRDKRVAETRRTHQRFVSSCYKQDKHIKGLTLSYEEAQACPFDGEQSHTAYSMKNHRDTAFFNMQHGACSKWHRK